MSFGTRLRELRQGKGLSREVLAERSGLSRGAVRDYEQGHREPSLRSAFQLADALGVKVDDFRNGQADEGAAPPPAGRQGTANPGPASRPAARKKPAPGGGRKRKGRGVS
jgi:transcriptional regulator with XRE-family HTH domain